MLIHIRKTIDSNDIEVKETILIATSTGKISKSIHLEIDSNPFLITSNDICCKYVVHIDGKEVYKGNNSAEAVTHYNSEK